MYKNADFIIGLWAIFIIVNLKSWCVGLLHKMNVPYIQTLAKQVHIMLCKPEKSVTV